MTANPNYGEFPVLPIRNAVLFPGVAIPLRVGRPGSIAAIEKAQKNGDWILVVTQRDTDQDGDPKSSDVYSVGVLAKIDRIRGSAAKGFQILVRGVSRFRVLEWKKDPSMLFAAAEEWKDVSDSDAPTQLALLETLRQITLDILKLLPTQTDQLVELVKGIEDVSYLSNLCASHVEISLGLKQSLLETVAIKERVLVLLEHLKAQKENLEVQTEIRDKLSTKMSRVQRESILREHLKAIQEELGEASSNTREDYKKKIEDAGMPPDVRKIAEEEWNRLQALGNAAQESHVIRNYLDLLCAMPWNIEAPSEIDISKARTVLEADHYGMAKVKKRILEHLAVMKLKAGGKGNILLLVGPPGVGKTSIAQSIAKALGRKFIRASLGGVRDDSEIRGHRRTYVGAMPGRIVQSLKRTGQKNPVFLLDEIDKLGRGYVGDPASALLEVLDPEQNSTFTDHYLDVPFDLSHVFFVATANTLETIPGPLLDRMEVIELSGYTSAEKLHIAKRHLIPKQLEEHGLKPDQLEITDEAVLHLMNHYTREAGVRDLQRAIGALCRGRSEKVLEGLEMVRIEKSELTEILGDEKYEHEVANTVAPAGVVTGLAWTPQGGDILFIESGLMPGSGKLILTGQLGDVMKESAQIAMSLVRSRLASLVPGVDFDKRDVHVHVPAGAIPKDGPSAGVTLLTSIASLFTGRPVDPKLAMTGEITLRGAVTPVGGIKEKVIAAHRAGVERVLLSKRNEKALKEVPIEVRQSIQFHFVENIAEVLKVALGIDSPDFPTGYLAPAGTASKIANTIQTSPICDSIGH